MSPRRQLVLPLVCIGIVHIAALLAGFIAPYNYAEQDRNLPFAPPSRIHFFDIQGKFHFRPFVYERTEEEDQFRVYQELTARRFPLQFFSRGSDSKFAGTVATNLHLFGVKLPARISLMGTDSYGRDVFSRLVYGGRISLLAGLLATALSLLGGTTLGALSGFYGGWLDAVIMRLAELFLALPWLYLLFAVRAFLPLHITPADAFLMIIAVIGFVGWAKPARLVRGVVLSARERGYVLAGRGFGASDFYLLRRHIFPQVSSVILAQAALLIPQYILAEVTLSFLGLGVGEPVPSWGSILGSLQQYHVLVSCWWMFFPGVVLIPVFFSYSQLSQALQERFV
ncbi:MAG: ABC transporter permease [Candidatus Sulfotelmatobacter sp.]|jgi:peptide/nickel transport system permease protein